MQGTSLSIVIHRAAFMKVKTGKQRFLNVEQPSKGGGQVFAWCLFRKKTCSVSANQLVLDWFLANRFSQRQKTDCFFALFARDDEL